MKKFRNVMMVILDIVLVVVAIFFFAKVGVKDEEETNIKITSTTQENQDESLDIKSPDRIVFKNNEKYYVINSGDGNYNDLVEICVKNLSSTTPYDITESEIDDLKNTTNFVEFDYNTISKNYIFILDKDVRVVIRMKETDGTVVADEISNSDEIIKKFENEEIGKESYSFDKEEILFVSISSSNSSIIFLHSYDNFILSSFLFYLNLCRISSHYKFLLTSSCRR